MKQPYAPNQPYLAGETVTPGEFACAACGQRLEVDTVRNLPVCPKCQGDEWKSGSRSSSRRSW